MSSPTVTAKTDLSVPRKLGLSPESDFDLLIFLGTMPRSPHRLVAVGANPSMGVTTNGTGVINDRHLLCVNSAHSFQEKRHLNS